MFSLLLKQIICIILLLVFHQCLFLCSLYFNVLALYPSGGYWIGGNDIASEGMFVWVSGNSIVFENWDENEPSNTYSYSDCMRSKSDWRLHDMNCMSTYDSICEKEYTHAGNSFTIKFLKKLDF